MGITGSLVCVNNWTRVVYKAFTLGQYVNLIILERKDLFQKKRGEKAGKLDKNQFWLCFMFEFNAETAQRIVLKVG